MLLNTFLEQEKEVNTATATKTALDYETLKADYIKWSGRSKLRNEMVAKQLLSTKIDSINKRSPIKKISVSKEIRWEPAKRGDKRRTYRFQENVVKDHLTNKSVLLINFKQVNLICYGNNGMFIYLHNRSNYIYKIIDKYSDKDNLHRMFKDFL